MMHQSPQSSKDRMFDQTALAFEQMQKDIPIPKHMASFKQLRRDRSQGKRKYGMKIRRPQFMNSDILAMESLGLDQFAR